MPVQHAIAFLFLAAVPLADRLGGPALLLVVPAYLAVFVGLDAICGIAADGDHTARGRSGSCRMLCRLYIPLQLAAILRGLAVSADGADGARILALALAIGAAGGIFGVLAAHEMIHSRSKAERALGTLMLAGVACLHFCLAHVRIHHRLAATAADPATARHGESVYRFIARSLDGQWRAAWRLERGRSLLANRALLSAAASLAIPAAIAAAFGTAALIFYAVQSLIAIFVLEVFNYVAHYGLMRATRPDGKCEPFGPGHSWNTRRRFNNWALFNGGHHSDHHAAPARSYERLAALPRTPQLPYGYAGTMMLALIPPLWRRVMDPLLPGSAAPAPLGALAPAEISR